MLSTKKIEIKNQFSFQKYKSPQNKALPPKVEGFGSCSNNDTLYIFGGAKENGEMSAEIYKFDLKNGWSKLPCKGDPSWQTPTARLGASLTFCAGKLYVFGGCNNESGWLGDFWSYDIETSCWAHLHTHSLTSPDQPPSARDKTTLVGVTEDKKVYMYGGFGPSPETGVDVEAIDDLIEDGMDCEYIENIRQMQAAQFSYFDDLFQFDIETGHWHQIPIPKDDPSTPSGLAAHTMVKMGRKLVIFGGKNGDGRRTNDIWAWDLDTQKWLNIPEIKGDLPEGRSFHASCPLSDNLLAIFGGRDNENEEMNDFWIFDLESHTWVDMDVGTSVDPSARFGVAMITLKDDSSDDVNLVIFGGSTDFDTELGQAQTVLNDVHFASGTTILNSLKIN